MKTTYSDVTNTKKTGLFSNQTEVINNSCFRFDGLES